MTRMVLLMVGAVALGGCDLFKEEVPVTSERGVTRKRRPEFKPGRPADVPLPEGVPYVGAEGEDELGRPLERPDAVALLALIHAKRFEALDAAFAEYQSAFEADPHKEWWPLWATDAFGNADPALGPLLDAWIDASPKSAAAAASRGVWELSMAWATRGGEVVSKTSPAQLAGFREHSETAIAELERAIALNPKMLSAQKQRFDALRGLGADDEALEAVYQEGLAICDGCMSIREASVLSHAPRWGGTPEAMLEAAKVDEAQLAANPALKLLPSYVEFDACRTTRERDGIEAALASCKRATSRGVVPRISCFYGDLLIRVERYDEAMPHYQQALHVDPQSRACAVGRHWVHRKAERFELAAKDLLLARRLAPTKDDIEPSLSFILERLRYDAREAGKAGRDAQDRELRSLANAISPGAGDSRPTAGLSASNLDALREQVAKNPRDYDLHVRLDQALVEEKAFDEIVKMWDRFLEAQPDHARALLERAGARWHSGDHSGGIGDAQRACELGSKKACSVAAQMGRAR